MDSLNNNNSSKKRRALAVPTVDEFHDSLQALFMNTNNTSTSTIVFTEGAVLGLRQVYWTFLQHVARDGLADHDSLDDLDVVERALLTMNNGINEGSSIMPMIVAQAKSLLQQLEQQQKQQKNQAKKSKDKSIQPQDQPSSVQAKTTKATTTTTTKRRKVKKQKISADMEAEQERLLQQSKASMLQQQQQQQPSRHS